MDPIPVGPSLVDLGYGWSTRSTSVKGRMLALVLLTPKCNGNSRVSYYRNVGCEAGAILSCHGGYK